MYIFVLIKTREIHQLPGGPGGPGKPLKPLKKIPEITSVGYILWLNKIIIIIINYYI